MSHARIKILLCLYNSNKPETKTEVPRVDTSSHDVENSTPPSDCSLLGLMEPAHVENSPRDNVEVPPHPGKIGSHARKICPSISLRLQQTGDEKGDPWVDTAPHGVETLTPLGDCSLLGLMGASARRELPLGTTSRSRRTRGR